LKSVEDDDVKNRSPKYNITPGSDILAVSTENSLRKLTLYRWGYLPSWVGSSTKIKPVINAVSETVTQKKFFASAIKNSRCIVPMDGFYEWMSQLDTKRKIPYFIKAKDDLPLAVAGISSSITTNVDSKIVKVTTCAVLTCESNSLLKPIHDRMPVILSKKYWDLWLKNHELSASSLGEILRPADSECFTRVAVSSLVNNPRNDFPDLLKEI
jgi:putative SOS response-associated peptidase YedK